LGVNATPVNDQLLILVGSLLRRATVVQCLGGVIPADLLNKNSNLSDLTNVVQAKTNLSLNNVENKSSATIRGELTSGNVTTALGYTPVTPTALTTSIQSIYPVGSIYINASNATNPATLFGFGVWAAFGAGRVPVGFNAADPLFDTAGETGGSKDAVVVSHTHTITDPGHFHGPPAGLSRPYLTDPFYGDGEIDGSMVVGPGERNSTTGNSGSKTTGISINSSGSSGTNANLQPYITVYMWQRTA
jgi:hypothetical protein